MNSLVADGPAEPPSADVEDWRRQNLALAERLAGEPVEVAGVMERTIPGPGGPLGVRLYHGTAGGPLPLLVWFHGGGFVVGSIETGDALCRLLAAGIPALVASVEYRLAPEFPFPAAIDDCISATQWLVRHAEQIGARARPFFLGGESAGGTLAAVVSRRMLVAAQPLPKLQVLVYPPTDLRLWVSPASRPGDAPDFNDPGWWTASYLGGADPANPDASPAADPDPRGLPATLVLSGGEDMLQPEGGEYVRLLRQAGVDAREILYPGMPHGFFGWNIGISACDSARQEVIQAIRDAARDTAA